MCTPVENAQLLGGRFGVPDMTVNMHTVTIHEAKAKLSKLIEEALSGQEVVIARRNKPLVRLRLYRRTLENCA